MPLSSISSARHSYTITLLFGRKQRNGAISFLLAIRYPSSLDRSVFILESHAASSPGFIVLIWRPTGKESIRHWALRPVLHQPTRISILELRWNSHWEAYNMFMTNFPRHLSNTQCFKPEHMIRFPPHPAPIEVSSLGSTLPLINILYTLLKWPYEIRCSQMSSFLLALCRMKRSQRTYGSHASVLDS